MVPTYLQPITRFITILYLNYTEIFMTSEGRGGHEYVTIATQERQSVRYCPHKIPWIQENANIESGSRTPVNIIIIKDRLGLCHKQSE